MWKHVLLASAWEEIETSSSASDEWSVKEQSWKMHRGAVYVSEEEIVRGRGMEGGGEGRDADMGRGRRAWARVLLMMPLGASHFINYTEVAPLIQQGDEQALPLLSAGETNFIYCWQLILFLIVFLCVFIYFITYLLINWKHACLQWGFVSDGIKFRFFLFKYWFVCLDEYVHSTHISERLSYVLTTIYIYI